MKLICSLRTITELRWVCGRSAACTAQSPFIQSNPGCGLGRLSTHDIQRTWFRHRALENSANFVRLADHCENPPIQPPEYAVVRNDFLPSDAITFSTHAGS